MSQRRSLTRYACLPRQFGVSQKASIGAFVTSSSTSLCFLHSATGSVAQDHPVAQDNPVKVQHVQAQLLVYDYLCKLARHLVKVCCFAGHGFLPL